MSSFTWPPQGSGGGGGSGTVTSVSVATANGLSGTVANATTTPALTLSTSITGLLQGNGTALSAYVGGSLVEATSSVLTIGNGANSQIGTGTTLTVKQASTSVSGYLSNTDWNTFNGKQASLTIGNLTDVGTDGLIVTGGTGAIIGSGTSIAQHVADSTHNGYLSQTDWSTFNGKQPSGSYVTALTGDGTAAGPGSSALTLATVNSNVGSFGSSTSIPSLTVNAKGLVTAASGNVVIAPAGTLSGTTLNSTVVTSSLTSVGTIVTGAWNGTTIAIANGGTGQTTKAPAFDALSPMTTGGDIIFGGALGTGTRLANGSAGQVLTSNGTTLAPSWQSASGGNPFDFFVSSVINTDSSVITATSPTTFSNSPGFAITPNFTGTYKVYTNAVIYNAAVGGFNSKIQIGKTAGTGTLLSQSVSAEYDGVGIYVSLFTQSTFTLTAGQSVTFDIQGWGNSGSSSTQIYASSAACPFYIFAERCG